jgi:type I restriction enzyme S subunit
VPQSGLPKALKRAKASIGATPGSERISTIIDLMRPMTTEQSEIVATLYACWHDLIAKGKKVSDQAIINDFLKNWHEKKKRFGKPQLQRALTWMKDHGLVPTGRRGVARPKVAKMDF